MSQDRSRNTIIAKLICDYDPNSEVAKFFADPVNQEQITASLQDAVKLNRELCEARQVTPEMLRRVIDI